MFQKKLNCCLIQLLSQQMANQSQSIRKKEVLFNSRQTHAASLQTRKTRQKSLTVLKMVGVSIGSYSSNVTDAFAVIILKFGTPSFGKME